MMDGQSGSLSHASSTLSNHCCDMTSPSADHQGFYEDSPQQRFPSLADRPADRPMPVKFIHDNSYVVVQSNITAADKPSSVKDSHDNSYDVVQSNIAGTDKPSSVKYSHNNSYDVVQNNITAADKPSSVKYSHGNSYDVVQSNIKRTDGSSGFYHSSYRDVSYSHQTGPTEMDETDTDTFPALLKVPQNDDGRIVTCVNNPSDIISRHFVDPAASSDGEILKNDHVLNSFSTADRMRRSPGQKVSEHGVSDLVQAQYDSMQQEDDKEVSDGEYSDLDDIEDGTQRDIPTVHPVSSRPSTSSNSGKSQPNNSPHTTLQPSDLKKSTLSLAQQKEALLSLLKCQNGTSVSQTSPPPSSQCKILTKYVFINKSSQCKAGKKRFGVLYKNAFRHFHRSKSALKSHEKNNSKSASCTPRKGVVKKSGGAATKKKSAPDTRKKVEETDRQTRSTKETPASKTSLKVERKAENKFQDLKRKILKEKRLGVSNERKVPIKRRILSLEQKVAIIKAMEDSDSTLVSIGEEFGVSRTVLWRILKKREEILKRHAAGETSPRKRRKESSDVEIKQEKTDSEGDTTGGCNEEDDWFKSDTSGARRKSNFRNRKDLTLEEKVKVIKALEAPGTKINAMAKKFGVSVSSISRINKNKDFIMMKSSSGDLSSKSKRSRECKDPELDRVLLKWYRTIERTQSDKKISISNVLLKQKAHDLAIIMGKNYFPSDNWIIRWKHRHNLDFKTNMIQDRSELKRLDTVNIADIMAEVGKHQVFLDQIKRESEIRHGEKPEQFFICEHCGVLTSNKKKRENHHLPGCPASAIRKDLTLEEKVQVVRALEEPGVKMIHLAKRYGVSASAISRIAKNRVDILARKASGLSNGQRKRDRGSKEPEVEKVLCEWFKVQHEMGIHISGSMIREKARDIARVMGKDFWPSESWVFRWRQRNNVSDMNAILYADSEEDEEDDSASAEGTLEKGENDDSSTFHNQGDDGISDIKVSFGEEISAEGIVNNSAPQGKKKKKPEGAAASEKKPRVPRSVMCEKCGFVSSRVKNSRVKSLRHAKGCPDMKPRHELTYETRAQMLKALEEPGATLSSVARLFGVSVSSMSRINANKERILNHCLDHSGQKRIRFCKEPEVAHHLYTWYMEKKAEGIHITGPKLKEKARKMAAEMGRDFKASSGWLGRWRHRYNIVCTAKNPDKVNRVPLKKKRSKKITPQHTDNMDQLINLQPMQADMHQDSLGSAASIVVEQNEQQQPPQPQPPQHQQAPVFLHQRFSTPWEMAQQQAGSCVWAKEFLSPSGVSSQDESGIPVSYAYNDGIPKPVFHNMFDSFTAVGYQVAMPVDSGMMGRDYLKVDTGEDKGGPSNSSGHSPLTNHGTHPQHAHQLSANLSSQSHLQHHMAASQAHAHTLPHAHPHAQHQHHPHLSHPLPPPSPALMDEDPEQQRQVMEAFKIMNSFAQKRSLGEHVQAALRTIEMTMKNQNRKAPSRNTYTSI